MIAVLVPFFLTAQFATDSSWQYGPQYNFVIKIDIMTDNNRNQAFGAALTVRLICRPREFDSLRCHFNIGDSKSPLSRLDNVPFDISFNNKGIHSFTVPRSLIDDQLLNSLKYIVNLLSVGADLTNRPDEVFKETESFLQGECAAYFDVNHWPLLNESDRGEYNLNSLPSLNKVVGEAIRVEKNRDMNNCQKNTRLDFLLGPVVAKGQIFVERILEMKSSWNHITVTDTQFESAAELKAVIKSSPMQNPVEITEKLFLSLESITPAEEELRPVIDPVKTSILSDMSN